MSEAGTIKAKRRPLRWTLQQTTAGSLITRREPDGSEVTGVGPGVVKVEVREDAVTAKDVEILAQAMAAHALAGTHLTWDTIEDPGRDLWRHNAATILREIFTVPAPSIFNFGALDRSLRRVENALR